jgi:hypothetical protein
MSRYQTTMYNRAMRVEDRLNDAYRMVIDYNQTPDKLTALIKPIYESNDYIKLNTYYQGYISGIHKSLREGIYRYMKFCYIHEVEGIPTALPVRETEWTSEQIQENSRKLDGNFHWLGKDGKPMIDKVWR